MPILEQDIKLLKSQVMEDVPEGGGASTGEIIVDNVSNNIFADIPELSRITGAVNLRLGYLGVQTANTDPYRGARVVIGKPPGDPRVSALLFQPRPFDRRTDMQSRIESYLARGPKWAGYLYDQHIEGQRAIVLLQREGTELPAVGKTLVLVGNEGQGTEYWQYVRVTKVASQLREFTLSGGSGVRSFSRLVVTCDISDALRYDFAGAPATDLDAGSEFAGRAVVRDTVVADAARYYGASPLATAGQLGDMTLRAETIYASIVPSAQTETPIADARPNQRLLAVQRAGEQISFGAVVTLSPTSSLYVGGAFYPGSLSLAFGSGITLTDLGGVLRNGTTAVGTVDYANGVLTAAAGQAFIGSATITYMPAGLPTVPTETVAVPVTASSRAQTLSVTLNPIPAPGTLSLSYMVGGRWYVLTDNGSGALRGADSAYGAGNLSFVTGSLVATLGALPDVGSDILLAWGTSGFHSAIPATTTRAYFTGSLGAAAAPGTVTITWGGSSVADDGAGNLIGAGTGTLDYATGAFELAPDTLPAPGQAWSATFGDAASAQTAGTLATFTDLGATFEGNLPGPYRAGSFSAEVEVCLGSHDAPRRRRRIVDDAAGKLWMVTKSADGGTVLNEVGTIDAATGQMLIVQSVMLSVEVESYTEYVAKSTGAGGQGLIYTPIVHERKRYNNAYFFQGTPALTNVKYTAGASAAQTAAGTWPTLEVRIPKPGSAVLVPGSIAFTAGGHRYADRLGRLLSDIAPTTGAGADVGPMDYIDGVARLSVWPGLTAQPVVLQAALIQYADVLVTGASFRTPLAPLRPASLSIAATRRSDSAVITATADANGRINTASAVGIVNVQTGVARVWFRKAIGTDDELLDLSSLGIPGVTTIYVDAVYADTLRFGAVGYSYLPLDADVIGLDPVRLPTDGRVPIFRPGDVAMVHHTATTAPLTASNGQTVDLGRIRLARVRVMGNDGATIPDGYAANLTAGTVTFTNVAGYAQPVRIEHLIKDETLVIDAQLNGDITLQRPLTHDFPLGSIVSSALLVGTLFARVPLMFDQQTWTGVWSDDLIGSALSANYNAISHPPVITNTSTVTERWALVFTNSTTFRLIGEHLGVIAEGVTTSDFAPLNPAVGLPYFTIPAAGWGTGWATGNVLRLNTVGALHPLGFVRTIQQGDATLDDDSFSVLVLGDRDKT